MDSTNTADRVDVTSHANKVVFAETVGCDLSLTLADDSGREIAIEVTTAPLRDTSA